MWKFKNPKNPSLGQYWIPQQLPSNTEGHAFIQKGKLYKKGNLIVQHPGWIYDNGALVDDEYLFYNDGYKLVNDVVPSFNAITHVCEKNAMHLWDEDEKSLSVTYTVREKTQSEIDADKSKQWLEVKKIRAEKLAKLDSAVFIALENNLTLSDIFKEHRQKLRDIPENFTDPYSVVWPDDLDPFSYYE